jgi:hypothetical protein
MLVCLAGLALAGCSDILGLNSRNGAEMEEDARDNNAAAVFREDGSDALEGENIIWRDQEPYRLTLKADENVWENIAWYFGADTPVKTGPSLTLDARILKEASHNLVFTGFRGGIPYSLDIPFTVKGSQAGVISWIETEKNSSFTEFDLGSWTGYGEAMETWKLWAVESPKVYFTVYKRDSQKIIVEGTDAAKVTKAAMEETVDGSTASPELDVFTVDTGDLEMLFQGGERNFTLRVWEAGKTESKAVLVNLELRPRLTGAAIFAVEDGTLQRITSDNVNDYANELYRTHTESGFPDGWGIKIADVYSLSGALKWLDSYAKSGTSPTELKEYLVRVEKNEVLSQTTLSGYGILSDTRVLLVSNIKVRLRGYGTERRITHNAAETPSNIYYKRDANSSHSYIARPLAFLGIGIYHSHSSGNPTGASYITLQLEENITIDAAGGADQGFYHEEMLSVVEVTDTCTFVMEQGSKLTNGRTVNPVTIGGAGTFEMRAGEISYFKIKDCAVYFSATDATGNNYGKNGKGIFKYHYPSGVFKDNDSSLVHSPYTNYHLYTDSKFRG